MEYTVKFDFTCVSKRNLLSWRSGEVDFTSESKPEVLKKSQELIELIAHEMTSKTNKPVVNVQVNEIFIREAKVKEGSKIKFNFHCAGVVSQEKTTVTKVGKDFIQIAHGEPEYKFNKKTGECLNDSTSFGAWRTLPVEYLEP